MPIDLIAGQCKSFLNKFTWFKNQVEDFTRDDLEVLHILAEIWQFIFLIHHLTKF